MFNKKFFFLASCCFLFYFDFFFKITAFIFFSSQIIMFSQISFLGECSYLPYLILHGDELQPGAGNDSEKQ